MAQGTSYGGSGSSAVRDLKDKAHEQVESVSQKLEGAADSLAETGRAVKENVQTVADNARTAVEKSMKDQPLTTLAIAAGIGLVIGALWKS